MKFKNLRVAVSALVLATSAVGISSATEGMFALGYGSVQRGQGGAGVAMSQDAMSTAINPAATATIGREFDMGVELFAPFRGYETAPGGVIAPGDIRSGRNIFFVPNMAYNMPIDDSSALTFSLYGNGGMNTSYTAGVTCGLGGPGVFCGGKAGVDLNQAFISVGYSKKIGNVSIGIAPTLAVQAFKAEGLGLFGIMNMSSDPTALSNNGYDWSFGGGIRLGALVDVTDTFRLGISGQTPMWMTRFKKYAGLFEGGGSFDIPASVTIGAAWDVKPDLTLMLDYQHIFYSGTKAISNPFKPAPLGSDDGPGFGWDDVDVFKIGAEWRQNEKYTWRAGYAYTTNPVGPEDVTFGILAPGVVQHHITGGGTMKVSETSSIDFALVYAFSNEVTGPATMFSPPLTIEMHQFEASIGWKKRF